MNTKKVGKYFVRDKQLWQCIAYCDQPTIEYENVNTGERICVAVGSLVDDEFLEAIDGSLNSNKEKESKNG